MVRIVNLVIIVLELISLAMMRKAISIKKSLIFYTQLSNLMTLFASILVVVFGSKDWVMVLRYLSVCMLVMTFLVTACILVPMSRKPKELLFSGTGLYHHLLIPIISTLSYLFIEKKAPFFWIWLPPTITLIYGMTMLYLNYKGRVDGPYPFFKIKEQGALKTVLWTVDLFIVVNVIAIFVYRV